jgi:hypothetical protein
MYKETKVNFRKDGSIKSKSIIESKAYGSLPSVREKEVSIEWFRPMGRRRKVYSTRILVVEA